MDRREGVDDRDEPGQGDLELFPGLSKQPASLNRTAVASCRPPTRGVAVRASPHDDLARRTWEHRAGLVEGFTKQYGLTRLVFAEHYNDMRAGASRNET